ncbi:MAG: molecular chaperone TorD family protein [Campylobacteraceae bacterium]
MNLFTPVVPKILGALFYYSPKSQIIKDIIPALVELDTAFPWKNADEVKIRAGKLSKTNPSSLEYDFSVLFEGQGEMTAPHWASVYLSPDNLLMGETTQEYRDFMEQNGINLTTKNSEPDDSFGLMLMALSLLFEQEKDDDAKELLSNYLLTWSSRYLEFLQKAKKEANFYTDLAKLASLYLETLKEKLNLEVKKVNLYL